MATWTPEPHQSEFIDWLIDPNREGSIDKWARDHGLTPHCIRQWRRRDGFKKEMQRRADELNVGPERIQNVVNAMYQKALDGDTKAMQLYLQYTDRFTPTTRRIVEGKTPEKMSDDELAAALGKNVTPITKNKEAANG